MQENQINNEELWKIILGELELSISKASFTTWFTNTSIHSVNENQIIVNVPNIFAKEWLEKKYKKDILTSIQKYYPEINSFSCQINQFRQTEQSPKTPLKQTSRSIDSLSVKKDTSIKQQNSSSFSNNHQLNQPTYNNKPVNSFINNLNTKYSFDNFIVSSNNELAHAACQSISNQPGENYNPLFIYGGVGLGKTHLLQSTGNKILENFPNF